MAERRHWSERVKQQREAQQAATEARRKRLAGIPTPAPRVVLRGNVAQPPPGYTGTENRLIFVNQPIAQTNAVRWAVDTGWTGTANFDGSAVWIPTSSTVITSSTVHTAIRVLDSTRTGTWWGMGNWQPAQSQSQPLRSRIEAGNDYDRERREANARAETLLRAHLDAEQLRSLIARGSFVVTSPDGRRFEVTRGRAHNVYEIDAEGRRVVEYCGHPQIACPDADTMLAQKLLIQHSASEFELLCNRWSLSGVRRLVGHAQPDRLIA